MWLITVVDHPVVLPPVARRHGADHLVANHHLFFYQVVNHHVDNHGLAITILLNNM
jgi:hypothetical protein